MRKSGEDAPGRIRTCDRQLRRLPLYPLSYWGATGILTNPQAQVKDKRAQRISDESCASTTDRGSSWRRAHTGAGPDILHRQTGCAE